ncbi:hypothetical protein VIGAN_02131500, partial [Vigna angularis var. angularis]
HKVHSLSSLPSHIYSLSQTTIISVVEVDDQPASDDFKMVPTSFHVQSLWFSLLLCVVPSSSQVFSLIAGRLNKEKWKASKGKTQGVV